MKRLILIIAAATLFTGCATQQIAQQPRIFFPTPEDPKLEYLGTYQHSGNMKEVSTLDALLGTSTMDERLGHDAPYSIAVATNKDKRDEQRVYVTDINRGDVLVWDFKTKSVRTFGKSEGYEHPTGVATDAVGNVYISDRDTRKIYVFDPNEKLLQTMDLSKYLKSTLNIAIDDKLRRLIVADVTGFQVGVFDLAGKFLFKFGKVSEYNGKMVGGDADGEFNRPVAIAIDKTNSDILVADTFNARVQRFNKDGEFVSKFGGLGDGEAQFGVVKGLNIDSDSNIYVTDGKHHRISIFNRNGEILFVMGDRNTSGRDVSGTGTQFKSLSFADNGKLYIGGFVMPQGVAVDEFDRIYIADSMNHGWQSYQYIKNYEIKKDELK